MITVFVRGGLGNQMFQYATGLALADKNHTQVTLDTAFLNDRFPRRQFTYRTLDLDVFGLRPKLTLLGSLSQRFPIPGVWLALDLAGIKLRSLLGLQKAVYEKQDGMFDSEVSSTGANTLLFGYWQNEKYFSSIADKVRATFRFSIPLEGEAVLIKKEIVASESVALCVRRGDFVNFAAAKKMMGETNSNYYSRGIEYMNAHVKNPRYFVFSDDIAWCKDNLGMPADTVYIDKLGPKWSFHLELMSLCKHSIITNSTFYWWGAWLNQNPDKIVVAPAQWYFDRDQQPDIVPQSWVKL